MVIKVAWYIWKLLCVERLLAFGVQTIQKLLRTWQTQCKVRSIQERRGKEDEKRRAEKKREDILEKSKNKVIEGDWG